MSGRGITFCKYELARTYIAAVAAELVYDLIDRPNEKPWGAGEPAAAVVPSAISNAVFDAVGVRLRSVPFTPDKVKAAMKGAA